MRTRERDGGWGGGRGREREREVEREAERENRTFLPLTVSWTNSPAIIAVPRVALRPRQQLQPLSTLRTHGLQFKTTECRNVDKSRGLLFNYVGHIPAFTRSETQRDPSREKDQERDTCKLCPLG